MSLDGRKTLLCWSSGKDCAWALHRLRSRDGADVVGLLTTLNGEARRVSMHAVREQLLEAQANAAGLPLTKISLPNPCSSEQYEALMANAMAAVKADGVTTVAFGDLFLEGIREYRCEKLAAVGMEAVFPLWGADTAELSREMVRRGLRAHVTCVDPKRLDASFCGRTYDEEFLDDLPPDVDPCGENGEFHTFAYEGPMFERPIGIVADENVERDGFVFADVVAATS